MQLTVCLLFRSISTSIWSIWGLILKHNYKTQGHYYGNRGLKGGMQLTITFFYTTKGYLHVGNKTRQVRLRHQANIQMPGAATQAGLAYRVMGLVCERSVIQISGEPPWFSHPAIFPRRFKISICHFRVGRAHYRTGFSLFVALLLGNTWLSLYCLLHQHY